LLSIIVLYYTLIVCPINYTAAREETVPACARLRTAAHIQPKEGRVRRDATVQN